VDGGEHMNDFIMRTISESSQDGSMEVIRKRTSEGYACIMIKVLGYQLTFENNDYNNYEQQVLELAKMMDKIANNSCLLSEIKP
jgi:hypothetical protein